MFSHSLEMGATSLIGIWQASTTSDGQPLGWFDRFVAPLLALSGEYLFFIGATYIALLLLWRRRWFWSAATFGLAVVWLTFHLQVSLYLESLGADSFAETHNFDLEEAKFWFRTLGEAIHPDLSIKKLVAYLAVALASFHAVKWLFDRLGQRQRLHAATTLALGVGMMVLAVHHTTSTAVSFYMENSEKFYATLKNYESEAPDVAVQDNQINLVVYIGESTSVMNMGLYGYPRPTTPRLSALAEQDKNLLVFDNVFATHAHTSRSLLEALSLGLDPHEAYLPITDRKRVSVVDVLKKGGIDPKLFSNQGLGGSWDQASSVIFKHSSNTFRSRLDIDGQAAAARPWDDEFFEDQLKGFDAFGDHRQVVFLHSYSGHGPYYKNIPERFRTPVDDRLQQMSRQQVVRDAGASIEQIEEYDAAIRYVDYSVSKTLELIRQSPRPTVLLYFSDHGDAVYAGIGHDSARFKHEMARVPFLMYFNPAAEKAQPELLSKYRRLAQDKTVATLAQLPPTMMDLLGMRVAPSNTQPILVPPVIGQPAELPPIMVRQTSEGITFVKLDDDPVPAVSPTGLRLIDRTDEDTRQFLASRSRVLMAQNACRANPGSFEEMSRQIMVLRCPAGPMLAHQKTP